MAKSLATPVVRGELARRHLKPLAFRTPPMPIRDPPVHPVQCVDAETESPRPEKNVTTAISITAMLAIIIACETNAAMAASIQTKNAMTSTATTPTPV